MIGIPVNRWLSPKFSISLAKIVNYLIQNGWTVDINYDNGSVLTSQRNKIINAAAKEHMNLLFVDSDMVFEVETLEKVLAASESGDLAGGLCFMRRMPFKPVVFSEDLSNTEGVFRGIKMKDIPVYPFKCQGVGCAFLFISNSAIEKILEKYPWPFNQWELPNGDVLGEDLSFMHRCNLLDLKIICVPNVDIGHITERIITQKDHVAAIELLTQSTEGG
jgi:hypothetical protein